MRPDLEGELEQLKAQMTLLMTALVPQNPDAGQSPAPAQDTDAGSAQAGQCSTPVVQNHIEKAEVVINDNRKQTFVTVNIGELEKADLSVLGKLAGRIEEESREGEEAAWRWVAEGARAVHGGATGGILVPNKKEDRVLRVRGGRWSEEVTAAALAAPTERLVWELVKGANEGLMKIYWEELEAREGAYLKLDKGLKTLMVKRKEELVGRGGPLYAVGVENAAGWRREGKKMPKPGEAAELEVMMEDI